MPSERRPPKIAFVYDVLYPWTIGGVEKRYWEIARRLPGYGLEPHLFGPQYWEGPRTIRRDGVWLHGVGPVRELYDESGRRTFAEPLLFARDLFPALLRFNADLIDCCAFPFFPWYSAKAVATLHGTPLLTTTPELWGQYWSSYLGPVKGTVARLIEHGTARLSRHEQCPAHFTERRLREVVRESTSVTAIPGGIDAGALARFAKSADVRTGIVVVSRLLPHKRVADVVEAFTPLMDSHPDCGLTIIGRGPEESRLRKMAKCHGIESQVHFLSGLDEEALYTAIGSAACLVLPSEREGQGLVVAEAQATGTPPIVAVAPDSAASEFISDRLDGLLYPVGDVRRLAAALDELLSHDGKWTLLSRAGLEKARSLDWDTAVVPEMVSLYRRLLDRSHDAPAGAGEGS